MPHATQACVLSILRLQIGATELAVDARDVTEIVRNVEIGGMPSSSSSLVRGAIDLHGELVPVIDVAPLLGQPEVAVDGAQYIVVVNGLAGRYGFLVNDTAATPLVHGSHAVRDEVHGGDR